MKHNILEKIIILICQYVLIGIMLILLVLRYKIKVPKQIFIDNFYLGISYLGVLMINIIILIFFLKKLRDLHYKIKSKNIILHEINDWIDSCYALMANVFFKIYYSEYIVAYTTHYLLKFYKKVNKKFFKINFHMPTIILIVCFNYDVFYLQKFYYSYMALYLLLIPLSIKICLYLGISDNANIWQEIDLSVNHRNIEEAGEKLSNGEDLTYDDFILTDYNTQFKSVEDAFNLKLLIHREYTYLIEMRELLRTRFSILILIRIFYTVMWGYILFFYPYPVCKTLAIIVYGLIKPYWSLIIIMMGVIINNILNKK